MQRVVVDSDIIIDHFRDHGFLFENILTLALEKKVLVYLPSVVYTEINSGQDTKNDERLVIIESLLSQMKFIGADEEISQKAGFLLRDGKNLKLGDAVVAATCLSLNAKLATRNVKDFSEIRGLKFFKLRTSKQL